MDRDGVDVDPTILRDMRDIVERNPNLFQVVGNVNRGLVDANPFEASKTPMTPGLKPRCSRRVRCSRLVRALSANPEPTCNHVIPVGR